MDIEGLKSRMSSTGQSHLVAHWSQLSHAHQETLFADLDSIDFDEMRDIFEKATEQKDAPEESGMSPVEEKLCDTVGGSDQKRLDELHKVALEAVAEGQVGVLLLAGGQGTRLGVNYPKGMFNLGLPSGKTLYQIQMERIRRLEQMATKEYGKHGHVVMYIMTSEHTKGPTEKYLQDNDYFGLKKENVVLFEQRMIPCFDFQGKIILSSPTKVARAPDGNGGLYWALKQEKILDHIETRGIKYLHAYCVDNVLVKVADPHFMGYAIKNGAESANKVVEKAFPTEAVGVTCRINGKIQVVEYSEIGEDTAGMRDPDGKLTFRAGNICNHFFRTDFLKRVCNNYDKLVPYHVAKKKIPYLSPDLKTVVPSEPNGIKLEKFVFDVFQFSDNFFVWECLREEEFSPLKNADDAGKKDTPTTARQDLFALHRKYIEKAGGSVEVEGDNLVCEISPLVSYSGENLADLVAGKVLKSPIHLT